MDNLLELILKADNGDVEAQMSVANYIIWEEKENIDPDWAERAVYYYECAAKQGNSDAMVNLGTMYRFGKGVERDIVKCFEWSKRGADLLNPVAYRHLGYALEIPLGYLDVNEENADYKTAYNYFLKGALLGDPDCTYKMGDMYLTGKYVEKDKKYAFKMYKQSYALIMESSASINLRLGECFCYGLGTNQDLDEARDYLEDAVKIYESYIENLESPEFYMSGYNRAKLLLKRIANEKINKIASVTENCLDNDENYKDFINSDMLKYPEPQYPILELEKEKEYNREIETYSGNLRFNDVLSKAESGDIKAMYYIAFYCFSRFEKRKESEIIRYREIIDFALYYYHKAVRNGCREAMYNLGSIYCNGFSGVVKDKKKAFKLYFYSSDNAAWAGLGMYYANGEVVEKNYEKAFKYFAKCALLNEIDEYDSFSSLATMYRNGLYVETDERFADYLDSENKNRIKAFIGKYLSASKL